mmetsp:Transcript_67512/g.170343  ORF Transcript_67512/g.170343 Transcript_67512/m.170343 type:complete len:532 (+) Transcript_67512:165-1760(+)
MAPVQVYDWSDLADVVESVEEEKPLSPLEKEYFNGSMLEKYEPCVDVLQKLLDGDGEDDDTWNEFESHFDKFLDFSWCSNWDGKKYDLIFYGVSGYTGYLTMEYLKRVALKKNPEKFTFAFAGRTVSKVQEMRDREFAGTEWEDTPILRASYDDVVSVIDLAKSGHVVINVAGPYTLAHGEVLIDACCHVGTHYCDVSGEIPWTLRTVELHEHAKQGGALISPSAAVAGGWTDMLTFLCAKKAREDYGEELRRAIVYNLGGGTGSSPSGGTLASRGAMSSAPDEIRKKMADPFTLGGFIPDVDRNGIKEVLIEHGTGRCTTKLRKEDTDAVLSKVSQCPITGIWRAPFTYSYFNTRIIRRSNQMLADLENKPYGRNFNFQEFMYLPQEAIEAFAASEAGQSGKTAVAGPSVSSEKEMLEAQGKYYKQGEGPPLEDLSDAWIAQQFVAQTTSGKEMRAALCGCDGYFETARCAVEWAMTVRFDYDKLPHKGGVLNAMVSGQEYFAQRLIASGPKFRMGEWLKPEELGPLGMY